jgi:hypothetical protein
VVTSFSADRSKAAEPLTSQGKEGRPTPSPPHANPSSASRERRGGPQGVQDCPAHAPASQATPRRPDNLEGRSGRALEPGDCEPPFALSCAPPGEAVQ